MYGAKKHDKNTRGTSFYGASLRAFQELFGKYGYSVFFSLSNNAFFIHNKHLDEKGTVDLSELHPKSWVESWKKSANKKKKISKKHLHRLFAPLSKIKF